MRGEGQEAKSKVMKKCVSYPPCFTKNVLPTYPENSESAGLKITFLIWI